MGLDDDIANARADVSEMKSLLDAAKRPKVQSELTVVLRRLETNLAKLLDSSKASPAAPTTNTNGASSSARQPYDIPYKNYSWDQSEKFVKFYLTGLAGVKDLVDNDSSFVQDLTSTSVKFKVCNLAGKNHVFEITQLPHSILPEKSHYKVKTDMVTVFLAKADQGQTWSHATAAAKAAADKKKAASAPSPDMSKDPNQGLMDMMKKMYDEGDDEMKRTINKAWSESRSKEGGGMPGMPDF